MGILFFLGIKLKKAKVLGFTFFVGILSIFCVLIYNIKVCYEIKRPLYEQPILALHAVVKKNIQIIKNDPFWGKNTYKTPYDAILLAIKRDKNFNRMLIDRRKQEKHDDWYKRTMNNPPLGELKEGEINYFKSMKNAYKLISKHPEKINAELYWNIRKAAKPWHPCDLGDEQHPYILRDMRDCRRSLYPWGSLENLNPFYRKPSWFSKIGLLLLRGIFNIDAKSLAIRALEERQKIREKEFYDFLSKEDHNNYKRALLEYNIARSIKDENKMEESISKIKLIIDNLFKKYYEKIAQAKTDYEKLRVVAGTFITLESMHIFEDGNGRTAAVIKNKMLSGLGFPFSILWDPNPGPCFTVDEQIEEMLEGIFAFKEIIQD